MSVGYDGSWISMTFSNKVTQGTFAASAPLDIPTTVGANTAYVGFTAGSGGLLSNQRVTDFTFTSLPAITIVPVGGNLVFSWPVAVGNFLLQETSSLSAPAWSNVSAPVELVGQRNQVVVPALPGTRFFRLMLQ